MTRELTILCVACMLLPVQILPGQQEVSTAGNPPQVRVRIPFPASKAALSVRTPGAASSDQSQYVRPSSRDGNTEFSVYRENIRGDSLDLVIEQAALADYQVQFPGLSVVRAAPALDLSDMAANLDEALTFRKYPTYEQYDSMMHYFADTYPSICRIDTFGTSVEGRLLLALKISDNVEEEEDEPAFLYTSTIHGDELVGFVLCLRFADFLLSNYGANVEVDRIINDVELWINPLSNPDGTYYPDNNSTVQESIRRNVNRVDLNRDFPDPETGEADDASGRQPETQHMMAFMKQIRPNLSANIHSGAEVVNYPWDHKLARHPDNDWYILISQEYADEAKAINSNYLNLYASGITNGADWYIINGGRQDYVNYYLHGREVTLELSYVYRLESEYLDDYWNYNKWSMVNLVSQARYGIHGNVTDHYGNPVRAVIRILDHDNDSSWVESDSVSGNFYRYLDEGVYDLLISSAGFTPDTIFGVQVLDYQETPVAPQLISKKSNIPIEATSLLVYPNPARDVLGIKTSSAFSSGSMVSVSDLSGRTLITTIPPDGATRFIMDVSALQSGVYALRRSGDNHAGTVIFSIQY